MYITEKGEWFEKEMLEKRARDLSRKMEESEKENAREEGERIWREK